MDVTSLVYPKVSIEPYIMIVMKLRLCQDSYPLSNSLVLSVLLVYFQNGKQTISLKAMLLSTQAKNVRN